MEGFAMGKYESTVQINASTDKVWELVTNGERIGDWLSPIRGVDSVEPSGPLAAGSRMTATIGNLGGASLKFKEAEKGRTLRWTAGPFMAYMMMMPMKVELDLEARGDQTAATITFKTNPMIAPLMKMMTGLNFGDEAVSTGQKLKAASEG
jgi:carbon monoxide dehydrogenase subunit G